MILNRLRMDGIQDSDSVRVTVWIDLEDGKPEVEIDGALNVIHNTFNPSIYDNEELEDLYSEIQELVEERK